MRLGQQDGLELEQVVQGSGVSSQEVEEEDPEPKGDVEDALEGEDLGQDHPGVPNGVAEASGHRGLFIKLHFAYVTKE